MYDESVRCVRARARRVDPRADPPRRRAVPEPRANDAETDARASRAPTRLAARVSLSSSRIRKSKLHENARPHWRAPNRNTLRGSSPRSTPKLALREFQKFQESIRLQDALAAARRAAIFASTKRLSATPTDRSFSSRHFSTVSFVISSPSRSRGRSWTRSRSTACRRRWPRPRAPPGCRGPPGDAR